MNRATITRLNQDFYKEVALSFSSTRHYPWQSWDKFLSLSRLSLQQQLEVADIGCGNGRLALWLAEKALAFQYYGCDSNEDFLREVQNSIPSSQTQNRDLVERLLEKDFQLPRQFDLICLFGVFHHLPSFDLRHELLQRLSEATKPGGELWLTAWTPLTALLDRHQVAQENGIDSGQLEPGDEFLGWKDSSSVRFVHCLQPQELEAILLETPWQIQAQWQESERGERGNACFLLRKK